MEYPEPDLPLFDYKELGLSTSFEKATMDAITNDHYIDDAWEKLEVRPNLTDDDLLSFRHYFVWIRLAVMKRVVRMATKPILQDEAFLNERTLNPKIIANILSCCYGNYLEISQFTLDLDDTKPGRAYVGLWQSNCTDSDYWIHEDCAFN